LHFAVINNLQEIVMDHHFEGKVALVTGAGSGIGKATALSFAARKAKVVVADIVVDQGEATIRMIEEQGGEAIFIQCDVTDAKQVEDMVEKTVQEYGRLDCAFNSAGISGEDGFTADCTEENWEKVININLTGLWLCMKYEIKQMLKQGSGAIVNASSADGIVGDPGLPAYTASKGGVIQVTRTAALEYVKDGIRINAVLPGSVRTPMLTGVFEANPDTEKFYMDLLPIGRWAEPEEIAEAVVWLCSDYASYVIGHAFVIDGGLTAA
jgi:NAD(P)-dependent dehydrogenase (short-subunit alcohol dehydrogenase family)